MGWAAAAGMAEAHSAVAFSFAITHEGVHVNYDREVLHVIWHSGLRSWRRNIHRFMVRGPFPVHCTCVSILGNVDQLCNKSLAQNWKILSSPN